MLPFTTKQWIFFVIIIVIGWNFLWIITGFHKHMVTFDSHRLIQSILFREVSFSNKENGIKKGSHKDSSFWIWVLENVWRKRINDLIWRKVGSKVFHYSKSSGSWYTYFESSNQDEARQDFAIRTLEAVGEQWRTGVRFWKFSSLN